MGDITKIPFSLAEMQLIETAEVFLTKKKAFDHVRMYLSMLQEDIDTSIRETKELNFLLDEFSYRKISHGESYKAMPYQVSDFPAKFSKENIFTVRMIVWWGYEVSVHLLLQGSFYQKYFDGIQSNIGAIPEGFYGCIANSPWEHHFEPNNYIPIGSFSLKAEEKFCKIGKKYALRILTKGTKEIVDDVMTLLKLLIKA